MESDKTAESTASANPVTCVCQAQPLMPVADAARLLRRSREYLYAGLRARRLPGASFGRSRLISRAFVHAFLGEVTRGVPIDFEDFAAAWIAETSEKVTV